MKIVTRSEWGALHGRGSDVSHLLPWGEVVFHTEAGALRKQDWDLLAADAAAFAALNASSTDLAKIRAVERFHAVTRGWGRIGYSFFITHDGTIFEGLGWGRVGAHTEGRNSTAAGICFQGHGDLEPLTKAQIKSAKWLIAEGIRLGKLKPNPTISSHHQYSRKGKTCCGLLVRPILGEFRGITGHSPETNEPKEGFLMALSDEEQKDLVDKVNGIALVVSALFDIVTDSPKVKKPNLLSRIRDGVARLEAKGK